MHSPGLLYYCLSNSICVQYQIPLPASNWTHRLKMATEVLEASEAFIAGLTGVWPLPSVTAQVTLQVRLPLHRVGAKGAFEAHDGVGVCKDKEEVFTHLLFCLFPVYKFFQKWSILRGTLLHAILLMMKYVIPIFQLSKR